jgi:hypothetical protein
VVLFRGSSLQGAPLRDTWQWDGENWTQLDDIGPPARFGGAMAYDATRDRVVLFAGTDDTAIFGDTWEWNGEDWTQMADSGPSARSGHAMVFDSARNRVVLFGGTAGTTPFGDTWEWDGNEWVQVEDTGPAARGSHAMTYDGVRRRTVLFGGISNTTVRGDTWEFDGTSWTQTAAFGPPPCVAASLVFNGRRALLYGGASDFGANGRLFHFTWEWDGRHWTARQDLGPGDRWGHTMVFDQRRTRGVLFGGSTVPPGAQTPAASGETWEQFEQGATTTTPDQPPPPTTTAATVTSLTATPAQPTEGQALTIEATLSATPTPPVQVEFTLVNQTGDDLVGGQVLVESTGNAARIQGLVLAAGTYTATAAIGTSRQTLAFTIAASNVTLVTLGSNPPNVSGGISFAITATLSGPAPAGGITVPLLIGVQGGPGTVWTGPQLQIAAGQTTGLVTIDSSLFGAGLVGTLTFTGELGGSTSSANVTFS